MAKQEQYRFSREKRQAVIAGCDECKGAPETEEFNLQGMCGTHCVKCLQVVDWVKMGSQTIIQKEIDRPTELEPIQQPIEARGTLSLDFRSFELK